MAILFTYLIVTVLLVLAVWIIIPQFSVLYDFIITSKDYLSILDNIGASLADKSELLGERFLELVEKLKDSIVSSLSELTSLVPTVVNTFGDVLSEASNLLIGTIISIYALASRKRLKALGKKNLYGDLSRTGIRKNHPRNRVAVQQHGMVLLRARIQLNYSRRRLLLRAFC